MFTEGNCVLLPILQPTHAFALLLRHRTPVVQHNLLPIDRQLTESGRFRTAAPTAETLDFIIVVVVVVVAAAGVIVASKDIHIDVVV